MVEELIYEAVLGFSQEEALVIAGGDEPPGELYPIKRIPRKKLVAGREYSSEYVGDGADRGILYAEYDVDGRYKVKVCSTSNEVLASCECMDFIIRGRNQEAACKHIAAVLSSHHPEAIDNLVVE